MRAKSKTGPPRLSACDRERRALELRRAGHSYSEIGRKLGCGSSHRDVTAYLDRVAEENAESARELVRLEVERLDALQAAVWDQAMAGQLGAVDRAVRIGERRAKLPGLEREKVELSGSGGAPIEVESSGYAKVRALLKRYAEPSQQPT